MEKQQKGKADPVLKIVLLLILLGVAFVYSYPLIKQNFPDFIESFDSLRGVYNGPDFNEVPAGYPGPHFSNEFMRFQFTQGADSAPSFYFVPAVSAEYEAHASLSEHFDIRADLYLIEEGRQTLIDSNTYYSWVRPRTMPIDEIPEYSHAAGFIFQARAGQLYRLDVIYEDSRGDGAAAYAGVTRRNTEIPLQGLLGYWFGGLVVFYFLRLILLFRKMNKMKKD